MRRSISNYDRRRERRRVLLAKAMLQLGARPLTITAWTGLTTAQIRTIVRGYTASLPHTRGHPPTAVRWFWQFSRRMSEGVMFGGWCYLADVIPDSGTNFRSISRGIRLCTLYRNYLNIVPHPAVPIEYVLLLAEELARKESITLGACQRCDVPVLVDLLSLRRPLCSMCAEARLSDPRDWDRRPKLNGRT